MHVPGDFEAIAGRQSDIGQDQAGVPGVELSKGILHRIGDLTFETFTFEKPDARVRQIHFVIDYQDRCHGLSPTPPSIFPK
jgi:hypothetical protein